MTTITVTQENGEVERFDFAPDTTVIGIGRRVSNEVCIPDRSVSASHARITIEQGVAWIEDLGSTNGTYLNGRLVSRRRLDDGDEFMVGKVRVAFAAVPDASTEEGVEEDGAKVERESRWDARPRLHAVNARTSSVRSGAASDDEPPTAAASARAFARLENERSGPPMHELDNERSPSRGAVIEIKNGAKSGQILPIDKPVTTLGRPGIQIAAIMRKPDGYFLMHIESDDSVERPTLNRDSIGDEPVLLHSGDELNVAGIDVEFMLS